MHGPQGASPARSPRARLESVSPHTGFDHADYGEFDEIAAGALANNWVAMFAFSFG
jgi:hypothetical protein